MEKPPDPIENIHPTPERRQTEIGLSPLRRLLKKSFGIEDIVITIKFSHNISWPNLTF